MQHWIITRDPWHRLPHHMMYNLLLHCKIESYLEIHKKMIPMCHFMNLRARHCDARVLYLGSDKISVFWGQGLSSKLRSWIQKQIWQKFGWNWSEKSGDHSTACNLFWVSIVACPMNLQLFIFNLYLTTLTHLGMDTLTEIPQLVSIVLQST